MSNNGISEEHEQDTGRKNNAPSTFHKPAQHPPYFRVSALHENLTESHPMMVPLVPVRNEEESYSAVSQAQDDDTSGVAATAAAAESKPRSGRDLWRVLQGHVEHESFLINNLEHNDTTQESSDHNKKDQLDMPYDFTLKECVLALGLYLLAAVLFFSFIFERWKVSDSMYFAVVTFTTIGYGDMTPTTKVGKLFTAVFALVGIAILSIALGVVGSKIIESEAKAVEMAEKEIVKDILHVFEKKDTSGRHLAHRKSRVFERLESWAEGTSSNEEDEESPLFPDDERNRYQWLQGVMGWAELVCRFLFLYTPALIPLFLAAYFIARNEGWTWYDSIYYCVVTTTTIGYGDISPQTDAMRWFAVIYIPLSVGAMGHFLGTIANMIIEKRRHAAQKHLWKLDLKLEDLAAMDANNDGVVTELEFVEFLLLSMRKVDKDLLDHIHSQFKKLDLTNSGTLVRHDLELMAKKRLRRTGNKLKLAAYKSKLLRQSSSISNISS